MSSKWVGTGFWVDMSVWRMLGSFGSVGFRSIAHRSAATCRVKRGLPVPPAPRCSTGESTSLHAAGWAAGPRPWGHDDDHVARRPRRAPSPARRPRARHRASARPGAVGARHVGAGRRGDRRPRRGVGARPAARHPPDAARAGRRGRTGRRRLWRRLPRLACRQLGPRLARCHRHRLHRRRAPARRRRHRRHRGAPPRAPAKRARLARCPRASDGSPAQRSSPRSACCPSRSPI